MTILKLENFTIGNQEPMTLMGGVNVLESESIVMTVAEKFAETTSNCITYSGNVTSTPLFLANPTNILKFSQS